MIYQGLSQTEDKPIICKQEKKLSLSMQNVPCSQKILKQQSPNNYLADSSQSREGVINTICSSCFVNMPPMVILNCQYKATDCKVGKIYIYIYIQSAFEGQYEPAPTHHYIHVPISTVNLYKCRGKYCSILCTELSKY